jgi:hypothetical protein
LIWAHPIPRRPYYAVVDFGGGTLDVTVMEFGKGLQKYGGGGRGSLNLRIQVHLPEHPGAVNERSTSNCVHCTRETAGRKIAAGNRLDFPGDSKNLVVSLSADAVPQGCEPGRHY